MIQNILVNSEGYRAQFELFSDPEAPSSVTPGVTYLPALWGEHETLFQHLLDNVAWKTHYGTRSTITWGESYSYRKHSRRTYPWPDFLVHPAEAIRDALGFLPNNCVGNYYPDGQHTIGFHSDQGMEMQQDTGVAIISLGAIRHMVLRRIATPSVRYHYALTPGSVLYMDNTFQSEWQHGILKEKDCGPRISLSFRLIKPGEGMG